MLVTLFDKVLDIDNDGDDVVDDVDANVVIPPGVGAEVVDDDDDGAGEEGTDREPDIPANIDAAPPGDSIGGLTRP